MAGFLSTTKSNLWTAMGIEICKSFYYRPHVLGICSDQKCDKKGLKIEGTSVLVRSMSTDFEGRRRILNLKRGLIHI